MWNDICKIAPMIWPSIAALLILVVGHLPRAGSRLAPMISIAGLLTSLLSIWVIWPDSSSEDATNIFAGALRFDGFGLFLAAISAFCALGTLLLAVTDLERRDKNHPEFYVLVLFAAVGMMVMTMGQQLFALLLGLEVMSIALYVLAGYFRDDERSVEASIKYYLTGSFATALFLFGMGLIYGGAGSLDLVDLGLVLSQEGVDGNPLVTLGVGFLVAGFAFKIGAVPFHMWLPDVYEGAPTAVTGFMATGVKVAAFGSIIRIFCEVYQDSGGALRDTLWWVALLTMSVGNLAALAQKRLKRMLAYSSISHAGYLMIGIVVMTGEGGENGALISFASSDSVRGILYYLVAYAIANIGAFGILAYLEASQEGPVEFDDLAGQRKRYPLFAFALSVFMLSLAGIPGTAGFLGKMLVFGAAMDATHRVGDESFTLLALLAILNSLVGLYYYLRVPIQLYAKALPGHLEALTPARKGIALVPVIAAALFGTLWLGFGPDLFCFGVEPMLQWVDSARNSLR